MVQRIICLGDSGSGGGRVVTATTGIVHNNRAVARKGDLFDCAIHKGRYSILGGDPRIAANDSQLARDGDPIACGCTLQSIDPNAGVVLVAKGRSAMPTIPSRCIAALAGEIARWLIKTPCGYGLQTEPSPARAGQEAQALRYRKDCGSYPFNADPNELWEKDMLTVCTVICCCTEWPSKKVNNLRAQCFSDTFIRADEMVRGRSRFRPEVTYDMHAPGGPDPQEGKPILRPGGRARRPDLVIARNPHEKLDPNNIVAIIEVRFTMSDGPSDDQIAAYQEITPDENKVIEIDEKKCACKELKESLEKEGEALLDHLKDLFRVYRLYRLARRLMSLPRPPWKPEPSLPQPPGTPGLPAPEPTQPIPTPTPTPEPVRPGDPPTPPL